MPSQGGGASKYLDSSRRFSRISLVLKSLVIWPNIISKARLNLNHQAEISAPFKQQSFRYLLDSVVSDLHTERARNEQLSSRKR